MPTFTLSFCTIIVAIYILDTFLVIPKSTSVTLQEILVTGHNKGTITHALHLSDTRIKSGEVWRLISSALLHVGTLHIASNLTAMLIIGCTVESMIGTTKTLI